MAGAGGRARVRVRGAAACEVWRSPASGRGWRCVKDEMQKTVVKDEVYIVTSPTACTISCEHNGETLVLCQVSPGQQKSFLALEDTIEVSSADADIRNFRSAPACYALGGGLFGGDGDASLREGATASVKAQCELAPTDLHQGGTLTDGTVTVEMDEPEAVAASGWLQYDRGGCQGWVVNGVAIVPPDEEDVEDENAWQAAVAAADCGVRCTSIENDVENVIVYIEALEPGESGNAITLEADAGNEVSGATLEGGSDGEHSLAALMEAINASTSFSATAGIGIGEGGILLTAKESGAAANSVVYTATGCFGSGEVHQGSVRAGADSHVGIFACGVMQTCRYLVVGESSMHIVWPADWTWREGRAPRIADDTNYIVEVFNDGHRTMAQVSMTYDRTND